MKSHTKMSSSICQHFTQNAWKKDLCSNCFKSKDEHRQAAAAAAAAAGSTSMASSMSARLSTALSAAHAKFNHSSSAAKAEAAGSAQHGHGKKSDYPNRHKQPAKSSLKRPTTAGKTSASSLSLSSAGGRARRVAFSKSLFEVIGYGGEWSDNESGGDDDDYDDDDDDHDFMNLANDRDDLAAHGDDDEETLELKRITRANTDFNMNNGNLLGDAQDNIKRSFAALKLGAPQVDKEGRKQTLKINVVPFGAPPGDEPPKKASAVSAPATPMKISTTTTATTTTASAVKTKFELTDTKTNPLVAMKKITTATATALSSSTSTTTTKVVASLAASSTGGVATPARRPKEGGALDSAAASDSSDGKNSPPIERAMQKSLLDEISETLEQKQNDAKKLTAAAAVAHTATPTTTTTTTPGGGSGGSGAGKIKFEIGSLTETIEQKPPFLVDPKKSIARNAPITKDTAKPRVTVAHKFSDTDSSDGDNNSISAYYDVVETQVSYENLPDGKCQAKAAKKSVAPPAAAITATAATATPTPTPTASNSSGGQHKAGKEQKATMDTNNKSIFSSSQYITDMLLSSKTRAASYSLHEGNFLTATSGQITADGLIVSKCSGSDDALDSTGSSFDGSSDDDHDDEDDDEEEDEGEESSSYNMTRSESDSGIGISIVSGGGSGASSGDYKNIKAAVVGGGGERSCVEKKLSASTNNSDYEDIQVTDQRLPLAGKPSAGGGGIAAVKAKAAAARKGLPSTAAATSFCPDKSRELHGEPDGSADPDGSLEGKETGGGGGQQQQQQQLPALPKSPPPAKIIDARPSFLHGLAPKPHQPPMVLKKPDLPAKPVAAGVGASPAGCPLKPSTISGLRRGAGGDQQQQAAMIQQLQLVMRSAKSSESLSAAVAASAADEAAAKASDEASKLRKGRAPNPPPETKGSAPPTPERDYSLIIDDFEQAIEREAAEQRAGELAKKPSAEEDDQAHAEAEVRQSPHMAGGEHLFARQAATTASQQPPPSPLAASFQPVASPEKKKRERAVINPKFRSLNTFVMQRTHNAKNLQLQNATAALSLKQPMTPEPLPRHPKPLSMSEECLTAAAASSALSSTVNPNAAAAAATPINAMGGSGGDKKLYGAVGAVPSSPPKTKNKFSIKKFLRMGHHGSASKTAASGSGASAAHDGHSLLKGRSSDGIYSEICTGDDAAGAGKPRLVIIHPIDINPAAVEVVRNSINGGNIGNNNNNNNSMMTVTDGGMRAESAVAGKPPAPPLRASAELSKPARPPPPKSAELRRKQKSAGGILSVLKGGGGGCGEGEPGSAGGSMKCKADNVYANLGEIRSSIAPRKPERTASMREREAQLELVRKRHVGAAAQADTVSICSSNGDFVSAAEQQQQQQQQHLYSSNPNGGRPPTGALNKLKSAAAAAPSPQLSLNGRSGAALLDAKPPSGSRTSTFERQKKTAAGAGGADTKLTAAGISSKLEIFEQRAAPQTGTTGGGAATAAGDTGSASRPGSLKDTVRKINSTIDSYLKDKRDYENMYEFVKIGATSSAAATSPTGGGGTIASASATPNTATPAAPTLSVTPAAAATPPPPPARSLTAALLLPPARANRANQLYADTMSIASYTRSEYGPVRHYGHFNGSLANIPRVISASYCGSEAGDIDIYSPYSYYGSEAGGDVAGDINDSVWGVPSAAKNRSKTTNRLRMRKGRSVVHKTIEDNYTAVVVANHEALAQVLEQLQLQPIVPPALRPLANAINLRFEDFTILDGAQAFVVGKKAFHAAVWTSAPVTLALSADCNQLAGVGGELNQLSGGVSGVLNPITEFCDLVPSYHLPLMPSAEVSLLQATISVLPRLQLDTLQSIGAILKSKSLVLDKSNFNFRGSIPNLAGLKEVAGSSVALARHVVSVQNLSTLNEESSLVLEQLAAGGDEGGVGGGAVCGPQAGMPAFDDVMSREVAFIMLQLVNGMKNLQVKAVEEMPLSLSNVVLSKDVENKDAQARLCVLQCNNSDEEESLGTLCKCAHIALTEMLPATKITPILADILVQERAESLSKAKSVLEFILWGPSDVVLSGSLKERELALQRWLDLERATVLHGLVRTRVELTVYDECHLMFLVRSTAKMMNDAAKVVCNYQLLPGLQGGSQVVGTAGSAH